MLRRLTSLSIALTIGLSPAAQAAACYDAAETSAVHVRMLQSELMVAALACRDSNPELRMIDQYNGFIRRFNPQLASHSKVLQAHFQKDFGKDYQRWLDGFITALANDASKHSMVGGYCEDASKLFVSVTGLPGTGLEKLSAERAHVNGTPIVSCTADGAARSAVPAAAKPAGAPAAQAKPAAAPVAQKKAPASQPAAAKAADNGKPDIKTP